ncbi:MAG: cell division protein ZapA [Muribaculaceae bacterium]|nr:cell division protein ZapA [Muribaculaceae bacterium]
MAEKQHITVRIADLLPLHMDIVPDQEEAIRKAEVALNYLWERWKLRFPTKAPQELMTLIAFHFARNFETLNLAMERMEGHLKEADGELDEILTEME